jgi:hypothetical protein
MALAGAIAGFRVTKLSVIGVRTAVIVDIDEVEADDPRARAEDHLGLLNEEVVDDYFEVVSRDGVKLSERVIVRVRSTSGVGDGFDGLLIDSSLQQRLTDDPGVEGCGFDSGYWEF